MWRYLGLALAVLVLDQASKLAAVKYLAAGDIALAPFLNLSLVYNTGAAFGMLNDAGGWQNGLFIAVAGLVSIGIVWMMRRESPQGGYALGFILGGALGNVIDRLRLGRVVDFVDFHIGDWHWYVFNIADAAITVGAVLLALHAFGVRWPSRASAP